MPPNPLPIMSPFEDNPIFGEDVRIGLIESQQEPSLHQELSWSGITVTHTVIRSNYYSLILYWVARLRKLRTAAAARVALKIEDIAFDDDDEDDIRINLNSLEALFGFLSNTTITLLPETSLRLNGNLRLHWYEDNNCKKDNFLGLEIKPATANTAYHFVLFTKNHRKPGSVIVKEGDMTNRELHDLIRSNRWLSRT